MREEDRKPNFSGLQMAAERALEGSSLRQRVWRAIEKGKRESGAGISEIPAGLKSYYLDFVLNEEGSSDIRLIEALARLTLVTSISAGGILGFSHLLLDKKPVPGSLAWNSLCGDSPRLDKSDLPYKLSSLPTPSVPTGERYIDYPDLYKPRGSEGLSHTDLERYPASLNLGSLGKREDGISALVNPGENCVVIYGGQGKEIVDILRLKENGPRTVSYGLWLSVETAEKLDRLDWKKDAGDLAKKLIIERQATKVLFGVDKKGELLVFNTISHEWERVPSTLNGRYKELLLMGPGFEVAGMARFKAYRDFITGRWGDGLDEASLASYLKSGNPDFRMTLMRILSGEKVAEAADLPSAVKSPDVVKSATIPVALTPEPTSKAFKVLGFSFDNAGEVWVSQAVSDASIEAYRLEEIIRAHLIKTLGLEKNKYEVSSAIIERPDGNVRVFAYGKTNDGRFFILKPGEKILELSSSYTTSSGKLARPFIGTDGEGRTRIIYQTEDGLERFFVHYFDKRGFPEFVLQIEPAKASPTPTLTPAPTPPRRPTPTPRPTFIPACPLRTVGETYNERFPLARGELGISSPIGPTSDYKFYQGHKELFFGYVILTDINFEKKTLSVKTASGKEFAFRFAENTLFTFLDYQKWEETDEDPYISVPSCQFEKIAAEKGIVAVFATSLENGFLTGIWH